MAIRLPPPPGAPPPRPDAGDEVPQATWSPLEAIPVFFLALLVGVGGGLAARAFPSCGPQTFATTLVGELAFGIVVVLWVRFVSRGPLRALGLPRRPLGDLAVGLGAGAVLVVVSLVFGELVIAIARLLLGHTPVEPNQVPTCVRGGWLTALAPVVVIAAPLGEETFFRGFLFKGLRRRLRFWPAALISGAAFGLVHVYPLLIPTLFVIGVGLAWVYERRQSLLASMATHAAFNLFGIIVIALSRR